MIEFLALIFSFALVFYILTVFQNKINDLVMTINDLKNTIKEIDDDFYSSKNNVLD